MVSLGEEKIYEDETVVVRQDEMNPYIRMVITGQLDIEIIHGHIQSNKDPLPVNQVYMLVCYWRMMLGVSVIL